MYPRQVALIVKSSNYEGRFSEDWRYPLTKLEPPKFSEQGGKEPFRGLYGFYGMDLI
jgi:hypothetical protein